MNKKIYVRSMMVLIFILFANLGFPAIWYVSTSGDDLTGDGSAGTPWQTIQFAIDQAGPSDVILVAAGTYTEDLSIPAGKTDLEISGAGFLLSKIKGVQNADIGVAPTAFPNINILASGVKIHGFTIEGPDWVSGKYASGMIIGAPNIKIYDNAFRVTSAAVADEIGQAIQTWHKDNLPGVDMSGVEIHNNLFSDLVARDAGYEGIWVNLDFGTLGTFMAIFNNSFTGNVFRAITTERSKCAIVSNMIETDLAPWDGTIGGWQGINLGGANAGSVADLNVIDNTVRGSATGKGFKYGLKLGYTGTSTFSTTVVSNNFINNNENGIWSKFGVTGIQITNNDLSDNTTKAVLNDPVASLDCSCNWWGEVGSSIPPLVSGNVTYATFLENGTDSDPGMEGFQAAGSCVGTVCTTLPEYNFVLTPTATWDATPLRSIACDECNIYKLNLTAGRVYTFATGCGNGSGTSNFDTWIELFSGIAPYASILSNDDACGPGGASVITWTAPLDGDYYLKVRGFNTLATGDYKLSYSYGTSAPIECPTPPAFTNEGVNTDYVITPTSSWQATTMREIRSDECHVYKVSLTLGRVYTFATGCGNGSGTSNFDSFLELYDGVAPAPIASNDDACGPGGASVLTWTATSTADYYLKVRGFNSGSTGDYRLAYSYGTASPGTCQILPLYDFDITVPLPAGTWELSPARTITSNACHIYKVTLTAGRVYTFATGCGYGGATSNFDTYMELFSSDAGYPLMTSSDDACGPGGASVITWSELTGGDYFLKVRGFNSGSAGTYTLAYSFGAIAPVDCPTPPAFTNEGVNTDYVITPAATWGITALLPIRSGECHVYQVNVTAGRVYTFATGCSNGAGTSNFDSYLELYDGINPAPIVSNDDACGPGGASVLNWTAPLDGIYYLKVRGYNTGSVGDYRLAYAYGTGGSGTCQVLPAYDYDITVPLLSGTWESTPSRAIAGGSCHIYKVTLAAGNTYTFATGCGNGGALSNFDTYLELYEGSGLYPMMSSSDDACGQGGASVINWTETTGGDYYLKVRGFNTGSSGSYILSYSYGAAPVATCQTLPLFDYDITIPPVAGTWAATPLRTIIGGACDIYRVTLTAGLTYTFATGCGNDVATSNFDTYLELFSSLPGYPSVISDDDACGPGGASVINWTATGDGVYFLKVRGYNGSSAGGYVLSYSYGVVPPVTCPTLPAYTNEGVNTDYELTPTTVCTATPLRTITGGSCHIYKLTLTHDRVYTFETGCGCGEGSSNFDTFLELFDGTAPYVLISSNDDACGPGGASLLTWTATGDGVFYLKVRGYNSSSAGNYKLSAKYTGGKMTEDLEGNQSYDNLVKVYPNPARQLFTIMSDQPLTFDQVILTGFAGQQVRTWTLDQPTSNYQIDGSEFNPGVYIISLRTSDGWVRKKLSIIR